MVINFKRAKLEAVKSNRNVVLAFVPESEQQPGSYQVFVDTNNNGIFDRQVDRNLAIQPMRKNVVLVLARFSPANRAKYNPRGMVNGGSVDIRQDDDSRRYRLRLSSTGAVRVENLANSGAK